MVVSKADDFGAGTDPSRGCQPRYFCSAVYHVNDSVICCVVGAGLCVTGEGSTPLTCVRRRARASSNDSLPVE